MKSTVEELEDSKVKLSVEIPEEDVETAIDQAFRKIAKEVRLPGFRQGKVPRKVLEARLGKGYARVQALEDSLPNYYAQAVIEHDVDVIAAPEIELTAGQETGPVAFAAVVQVRPTVTLAGYAALEIEIDQPSATDAEVDRQLTQLRTQFAERIPVDRPVEEGDLVTIDITTMHNGEEVPQLTALGHTLEVGRGIPLPAIDEHLLGASVGESLVFTTPMPGSDDARDRDVDAADDADEADEGGEPPEELEIAIEVNAVEVRVLPELDDDFVEEASEFASVDELRADTADRISDTKRIRARSQVGERLTTALADLVAIEVPEPLVAGEIESRLRDLALRLGSQGVTLEQWLQATGQAPAALVEMLKVPAAEAARVDLALRAIASSEGIEVGEDELEREIDATAAQLDQAPETVRARFAAGGRLSSIRWEMRKHKAMEWLLDRVAIKDEAGIAYTWADLQEPALDSDDLDDTDLDDTDLDDTDLDDEDQTPEIDQAEQAGQA